MERDSLLYITRRKLQIAAHSIIPDELLSKFYFYAVLRKNLNLTNPKTFNEKIQWLKLNHYPYDALTIQCSDKYMVRDYILKKGYANKLVPLLGVWETASQIDWNSLPEQFVLKCNHGCAYNIVVDDKAQADERHIKRQLDMWLKEDFGAFNIELHYSQIKQHKIICEKFLGNAITDYKFFCFNGKPHCIMVTNDLVHDRQAKVGFFYLDGSRMPLYRDDYESMEDISFPSYYDELLLATKQLCEGFPFVRVDFFTLAKEWFFSELTFTPSAGMMSFNPDRFDLEWGKLLDISYLMKETGLCK